MYHYGSKDLERAFYSFHSPLILHGQRRWLCSEQEETFLLRFGHLSTPATITNNVFIASDEDVCEIPAKMLNSTNKPALKMFFVFYSMYGHMEKLAKQMKKGVDRVESVEVVLFRVPETLSANVLELMKVPPKDMAIPKISAAKLTEEQMLSGFFVSTETQGDGQETTT
ncbi:hypothetical protein V6N13_053260 [Hibiscus sabdariffa]|uniref:Flavodoxin-like domain-containing protein n=2 Tax=Hibiscus sabdariffa TaxID=183260 RepID=A0ABR2ATZ2_9ROSI